MVTTLLTLELKEYALCHGIDLIGITSAKPFIKKGRTETLADPKELLAEAQSIIVTAFYTRGAIEAPFLGKDELKGKFPPTECMGAITCMTDYYIEIIQDFLEMRGYKVVNNKDNKIPDKMAAVRAGIGKYGKNAVVLTREYGSYVRFVSLVSDAPLVYEEHDLDASDCGKCDVCIRSCPTGAIYEPFRVDQQLCITEWLWGTFIPCHLREKQENHLFGCGECVGICPKNKKLIPRKEYPVRIEDSDTTPELIPLLTEGEEYFRRSIFSFPMLAGVDALKGNAIIALGNAGAEQAIDPLCKTLNHPNPQIRSYSAWSLGKIRGGKAITALENALATEENQEVSKEIRQALSK